MPKLAAAPGKKEVARPEPTGEPDPEQNERVSYQSGSDEWYYTPEEEDDKVKVLLYAREGQGKTTSAVTAANRGKIMVINAESGAKVAPLRGRGINTANLRFWPHRDEKLSLDGIEVVTATILADLQQDPDSWFAVVVDTIGEIATQLVEGATDSRVRRVMAMGGARAAVLDPDFVDRDDYGVMTRQIRRVIRNLRDLPCHVIFTCLEREDDNGEFVPNMSPVARADLLAAVDCSLYLRLTPILEGQPTIQRGIVSGDGVRAKDRFDVLPLIMADPTFERTLDYVQGKIKEPEDERQKELATLLDQAVAAAEAKKAARATRRTATKKEQ